MKTQSDQLASKVTCFATYLSDTQIGKRYDVTRQTVWRWAANDPNFPKSIKFSAGCTRWKLSDIQVWEFGKEAA